MSIKISNLTAGSTLASADLLVYVDVSDTTMSGDGTTKKIEIEDYRSQLLGYVNYVIYFSQEVTDNPTIVELQNTTGETFTWTRNGVGQYNTPIPSGLGILWIPFASNYVNGATTQKVINGDGEESGSLTIYQDGTTLRLETYDLDGNYIEYSSLLGNTVIPLPEFRFYPIP
jgi:hypothetical protein